MSLPLAAVAGLGLVLAVLVALGAAVAAERGHEPAGLGLARVRWPSRLRAGRRGDARRGGAAAAAGAARRRRRRRGHRVRRPGWGWRAAA